MPVFTWPYPQAASSRESSLTPCLEGLGLPPSLAVSFLRSVVSQIFFSQVFIKFDSKTGLNLGSFFSFSCPGHPLSLCTSSALSGDIRSFHPQRLGSCELDPVWLGEAPSYSSPKAFDRQSLWRVWSVSAQRRGEDVPRIFWKDYCKNGL